MLNKFKTVYEEPFIDVMMISTEDVLTTSLTVPGLDDVIKDPLEKDENPV